MAGEDAGPLTEYARNLGLAFQIQDDILDVTGNEAQTGHRPPTAAAAKTANRSARLGPEAAPVTA